MKPPLEGSLCGRVGNAVSVTALTGWLEGDGVGGDTCGRCEDITVGALRNAVSGMLFGFLMACCNAIASTPAEGKRSSRFFARAFWMTISIAGEIAGFLWCNDGGGTCKCCVATA